MAGAINTSARVERKAKESVGRRMAAKFAVRARGAVPSGRRFFLPNRSTMLGGFFRHGSNAALASAVAAFGVARLLGGPKPVLPAAACGAALFFATEYGTHRFLFHARPSNVAAIRRLQHRLHYDHHIDPAKLELLFLPLWYVVPNLAIAGAAYAALSRDRDVTASLALGNVLALLYYEWVHYVAHVPYRPVTSFGRWIRKYHLLHHFKNEKRWFGVTNPAFDALWGTYASPADVERSETTRLLFPEAFRPGSELDSRREGGYVEK
jgi:hypothetical protein